MPAVKKEFPGREDLALALATFHPTLAALPLPPLPGYLAPLPAAAALPPAASLPASAAGYEALLAPPLRPPRAYLSLHEAAPHLHLPRDPLALERFSATAAAAPDFQPLLDNGEPCIEVECGANRALLYVRKLCQGSKGPSIRHRGEWLTPNEFQFVSGRETAKDWKRSIRHKGKSLKTLMSKGILQVHPPICDCPGCRISSPVNRGRLADKRTVALPAARSLKKERTPSFSASDGDSDGSGPTCGRRPGLKQEDGPHIRIMKRRVHTHWDLNISFRETSCSQDGNLPTLISSIHRSRHLVMPEHQSRCEFQRGSLEIGLGPAGDLLGKRLGRSPHISSDCSSEKRARSESPQVPGEASHPGSSPVEALLLPPELGPNMAPEDHYRRLVSALSEASTFEDPQRLYHLGLPSHDLLRVRQEVAASALRGPSGLEAHLPSSAAGQRRKQGLAQHREGAAPAVAPSFSERELPQPPPLLSPQNAPHIALGPHLRPPFLGVPSALCQTPGYGFLPPAQAEMFARQQELLRKQNLARLELPADLLRQKELEGVRPQLLAPEAALRPNDGAEELQRRGALLLLNHGAAPLLALPPQGPPGSGPPTPSRDSARRAPRKGGPGSASARPSESKEMTGARLWAQDGSEDEPPKDSDGEDPEAAAAGCRGPTPGQAPAGGAGAEGKGLFSGSTLPPPLPLGFPYAVSPYFHTGAVGGLSVDGEEAPAPEDVSKWTVDDVCNFVGGLSGCGEYTRVFREQGIDGETLPLLTEEHLLSTMGLKLGPALKIRAQVSCRGVRSGSPDHSWAESSGWVCASPHQALSLQVARRLGRVFYMASFPVALPLQPPTLRAPEQELGTGEQPLSPKTATSPYGGGHTLAGRASPKQENGTLALLPGAPDPSQPLC
ncbi:sterile alpha motif domain-containing protein 11 isoform X7 [Chlorocebus sabaeus]|uniref:sterile alpha motif domain-containing protein 11 isoform X7 n=1 Tax=Chlorocebus sabaeus TaxID=60711 RepID=UPI003BF9BC02